MLARITRVLTLLRDPRVGKLPRIAVLVAVAYLLWPIDLIPDWITGIFGWLDDLTLLWLALRWLIRSGPEPAPSATLPRPDAGS
jgi:uncharacterized membrane protein YkvA (DUF1232 family)